MLQRHAINQVSRRLQTASDAMPSGRRVQITARRARRCSIPVSSVMGPASGIGDGDVFDMSAAGRGEKDTRRPGVVEAGEDMVLKMLPLTGKAPAGGKTEERPTSKRQSCNLCFVERRNEVHSGQRELDHRDSGRAERRVHEWANRKVFIYYMYSWRRSDVIGGQRGQ